jgi:nicotinamidase-related amidase
MHPDNLSPETTVLAAIDWLEPLKMLVPHGAQAASRTARLVDAAKRLGIPIVASAMTLVEENQWTMQLHSIDYKATVRTRYSFADETVAEYRRKGRLRIVLTGLETHLSIQQSALDLLAQGWHVTLAVDCMGSRTPFDHSVALRRLETSGATLSTAAAILGTWCPDLNDPEYPQFAESLNDLARLASEA